MTGRRFKSSSRASLTSLLNLFALTVLPLAARVVEAQDKNQNSFSLNPSAAPVLDTKVLEGDTTPAPSKDAKAKSDEVFYENSPNYQKEKKAWARSAVGAAISYSNNALSAALFKQSQDTVLLSRSSETGYGIGAFLDIGTASMTQESMRFGVSLVKFSVSPDASVTSTYSTGQLEDSLGVFQISFLYRLSFEYLTGIRTLWLGGGAQMNYAFSSSRPSSAASPVGNLRGSLGISPTIAAGLDWPLSDWDDISAALEWHPMGGYTLRAGLRTAL